MLTEYFLDTCISALISIESSYPRSKELISIVNSILTWFNKELNRDSVPTEFKDKFDLALYISEYRNENKLEEYDYEVLLEKITTGMYAKHIDILRVNKFKIEEDEANKMLQLFIDKSKLCTVLTGKQELQTILSDLDSGYYKDDTDIVDRFETQVEILNSRILDIRKTESLGKATSFDLCDDEYEDIMDRMRMVSDSRYTVKTGFSRLTQFLPCAGFENTRFYLIGGTSGVGKSTMLINLIKGAIVENKQRDTDKIDCYLYITAENLIDETLRRLYCCLTGNTESTVIRRLHEYPSFTFKDELRKFMNDNNAKIKLEYVKPYVTKLSEIETIIERAISNKRTKLKAVYIDYLDLITSNERLPDKRLDLTSVTVGFKTMSSYYDIPIISVTQLNRKGYEENASLTQMSESMGKINSSDFVGFLQKAQDSDQTDRGIEYRKLIFTLLKNRNGPIDVTIDYWVPLKHTASGESSFNYTMREMPRTSQPTIGNNTSNPGVTTFDSPKETPITLPPDLAAANNFFVNLF